MASVEALQIQFQDGISAGAQAASQSMDKLADSIDRANAAADQQDSKIQRAGQSFTSVQRMIDGNAAATARADAANASYARRVDVVTASMTAQGASAADIGAAIARLGVIRDADIAKATTQGAAIESKFSAAAGAIVAGGAAGSAALRGVGAVAEDAAGSMDMLTRHNAGATREFIVMGDEILRGNFSRIPGSMLVLSERVAFLRQGVVGLASGMLGIGGAVGAGVIALGALGVASELSQRQLLGLQNQLRATRSDYAGMADEVTKAARGAAANPSYGVGLSDSRTAGQTIASAPDFHGTQAQLEGLIGTAANMALVFKETVPDAAKELAEALEDPGAEAEKLAKERFPGMTRAIADSIQIMADGGDRAGAFAQDLKILQDGTAGASQNLTEIQQALRGLDSALFTARDGGKSLADTFGGVVTHEIAEFIRDITEMTTSIDGAVGTLGRLGTAAKDALTSGRAVGLHPPLAPSGQNGAVLQGPVIPGRSERAQGLFQVLPSTAADLGVTPYDLEDIQGNANAGMLYLQRLYEQKGGDWSKALAQYGGYGNNVAGAQGYISGVEGQDITKLPPDALAAIQKTRATMPFVAPDFTLMAERVALQESGGHQYAAASPGSQIRLSEPPDRLDQTPEVTAQNAQTQQQSIVDQATDLAKQMGAAGSPSAPFEKAYTDLKLLNAGLAALGPETKENSVQFDELSDAVTKAQKAMYDASPAAQKLVEQSDLQIAANEKLADAYLKGGAAVVQATAEQKAYQQAIASGFAPGSAAFEQALPGLTDQAKREAESASDVQFAQKTGTNQDQVAYLQAETSALGMSDQARVAYLAHLQAEQELLKAGRDLTDAQSQAYLNSVDAITAATQAYQEQQQAMSEVANGLKSAFDTISSSITQAFVQGQGHAINFGNIMKSVASQVASEFLKLAVLNPLMNTLFGQSNTTLSGVITALSGGSVAGTSGGSGGIDGPGSLGGVGAISGLGALAGLTNGADGSTGSAFGSGGISSILGGGSGTSAMALIGDAGSLSTILSGSSGGGILSSLGLGNIGQTLGLGNIGGGISSILGTSLGFGDVSQPVASFLGGENLLGSTSTLAGGSVTGLPLTLGGLLGGVGIGSALGSLEGSLFGPGTQQSQELGMGGSLVGSLAGAAIGSIVPGLGTLFGGPIGGLRGGALFAANNEGKAA